VTITTSQALLLIQFGRLDVSSCHSSSLTVLSLNSRSSSFSFASVSVSVSSSSSSSSSSESVSSSPFSMPAPVRLFSRSSTADGRSVRVSLHLFTRFDSAMPAIPLPDPSLQSRQLRLAGVCLFHYSEIPKKDPLN
jgi:hypothetical protein